jgi:hypothetical protein
MGAKDIHALLVGVDQYFPSEVLKAPSYPSLGGCVHDAKLVEAFLEETGRVASLRRLTSTPDRELSGSEHPIEAAEDRPTYANLLNALEGLVEVARPEGQIVIHYSGHGGRAKTTHPEKQQQRIALDECWVPYDIGVDQDASYLRDWELAWYVQRMTEKGAFVTLLLDCCHAGGMSRAALPEERLRVRGGSGADLTERPASLLDLSPRQRSRALELETNGRGWWPLHEKFVLLAACRPTEKAMEDAFEGNQASGAMTHWLVDTLRGQEGRRLSYREVHQRLLGPIHCRFPQQTPVLEGEGGLAFLGLEKLPTLDGVSVLRGEGNGKGVLLGTGAIHGVGEGARFVVYREGVRSEDDLEAARRAALTLTELRTVDSDAVVEERWDETPVREGDRAVLVHPGPMTLLRPVRTVPETVDACGPEAQIAVLEAVHQALDGSEASFLTRDVAGEGAEGYEVQVDRHGALTLCAAGGQPLPDVPRPSTAAEAVRWLNHLAKYRNVQGLENTGRRSLLKGKIRLECRRIPKGWAGKEPKELDLWDPSRETFRPGDELYLRIHNDCGFPVNVAVLDLEPGWGIHQVYPPRGAGLFDTVEANGATDVYILLSLPGTYDHPVDIFKVVASIDPLDVHSLELPSLGEPHTRFRGRAMRSPGSLQGLLDAMAVEAPLTRHGSTAVQQDHWAMEAVTVPIEPDR